MTISRISRLEIEALDSVAFFGFGSGRKDGYGCREVKGILYTRWKTNWELELDHCVGVLESGVNGSAQNHA